MDTFFETLRSILINPIDLWRDEEYFFAFIAGVITYGIPIVVTIFIYRYVARKMRWYRKRARCQHCNEWTWPNNRVKSFPDCNDAAPCCYDCNREHVAAAEPHLKCPKDGSEMKKIIHDDPELIIDKCPTCGAVLLDKGELKKIREAAEDEKENSLILGFLIGTAAS